MAKVSPYAVDLDWSQLEEPAECAHDHGRRIRQDHALFVDLFRNGR